MSHPPILLFDFDGVIITQKALEYTALKYLRKKFYKWQNIENLRLIDLARLFEEADSKNRIKALINVYKVYKDYIPSRWRRFLFFIKFRRSYPKYEKYETLTQNLEEILIEFKKRGIPMGIVSNTSRERLNNFRSRLNLDKFFSVFISRDNSLYRKPNPYPIIVALNKIKKEFKISSINKENVFYIGDLPPDIECAKNAGVNSIALLSGHGNKNDLEKSKPMIILQDIKNILEIETFKKYLIH
ncbi:MAG: HAD family hydrolase [Candidatus Hodarchaeota archaeon]